MSFGPRFFQNEAHRRMSNLRPKDSPSPPPLHPRFDVKSARANLRFWVTRLLRLLGRGVAFLLDPDMCLAAPGWVSSSLTL